MHTPMPIQIAVRARTAPGVAFPVPELLFLRDWAAREGLCMGMRLDQVLDGVVLEEVVVLSNPLSSRRTLAIWRTAGSVVTQFVGAPPYAYMDVAAALAAAAPGLAPRPTCRLVPSRVVALWRRLLHTRSLRDTAP